MEQEEIHWFDGTFLETKEAIECIFPNKIIGNVFEDLLRRRAVIIIDKNSIEKNPRYFTMQPFDERGENLLFYVPFFGDEASKVSRFYQSKVNRKLKHMQESEQIEKTKVLLKNKVIGNCFNYLTDDYAFILVVKENDNYINVGTFISPNCITSENFDILNKKENKVFYMPLKRYLYRCPVCGQKTIANIGMCEICAECGYEDIAGFATTKLRKKIIKSYREEYLKIKKKDISYKWLDEFI